MQNTLQYTETERSSRGDGDLVSGARSGDKAAFIEIVSRYQALVCGIAFALLNDFAASEDAAQDAFVTAWRKLNELRDPERLRPWLAQIARNAALARLRRTQKTEPLDQRAFTLPDESPQPDELTISAEEATLVRDALQKLPEIYRVPLVLYYREGNSVHAVAEALGISDDAVKQRLARGREMLRDRMAGVVESVLTRTCPNAMFTMLVASAIGALAAPSAIAGTVYSGSSSLGTTLSSVKGGLAMAALITALSIPVGYELSSYSRQRSPAHSSPSVTLDLQSSSISVPSALSGTLFAEWRALHEKHGTNAHALPAIFAEIQQLKDSVRRSAFNSALIAEWVELDPLDGMRFFSEKGHKKSERKQFFAEWFSSNPLTAVDETPRSAEWQEAIRDLLPEMARKIPERVPEIVSSLGKPEDGWSDSEAKAFSVLAQADLASARRAAERVTGPNQGRALEGVARTWAQSDVDAAIAWAKQLPAPIDQNGVIREALAGLATVDPVSALDRLNIVPPGGGDHFADTTGTRIFRAAAETDLDATIQWLSENRGRASRQDVQGLSDAITGQLNTDAAGFLTVRVNEGSLSPLLPAVEDALMNGAAGARSGLWDWLKTQPPGEEVSALHTFSIDLAGWQDTTAALKMAAEIPATPQGDRDLEELARASLNGGNELERFDKLYQSAPDRFRTVLLKNTFRFLYQDNMTDPQTWIDRVPLLPDSAQPAAIAGIARGWASQSPEEAMQWAMSLPASEAKNGAFGAIAKTWVDQYPNAVRDWVDSLEAGPEREAATKELATRLESPAHRSRVR